MRKTQLFDADILQTNESIRYAIFKTFKIFQIGAKPPKITKIFGEKSSKTVGCLNCYVGRTIHFFMIPVGKR